ncbi:xanthine dehydrogenase small subunit [Ottowia sp. GY511]|uniref:Xanthine dehydrogenase small subunit n=1 Tax=Ottowia flava TaxID=2675430 RepID=A0ABW4KX43_9BURK|nr:xanthine dehydrogenase small subunit [Ottowia sp. GY511]TXK31344.1 xanthine dehydrogenase small subunit [Ottowia sp. GY511]
MPTRSLRFIHRGEVVTCDDVPPDRTLLALLREDLHCTAVKEGCASGDCGACTVTVAEQRADGHLHYRAVNSCIRLAHSVDGQALWTAADIVGADGTLHPAQRAMVECHGSQCGFCTPGFVMSLFTLHRQRAGAAMTRDEAVHALSGNLCRCTGYRPILDAAQTMHHWPEPALDEADLLQKMQLLAQSAVAPAADLAENFYLQPRTLAELLALRTAHPGALLAAGTTDVGLWLTKQLQRRSQIIDLTRVAELRRLDRTADALVVGAAVPLTDAFAALAAERPALGAFFDRFAGLPVRESGTLGGNVANGSPIGDSMPLLIALGATLTLASTRGERTLPVEDFYLAYRKTALAPDEVLAAITVPHPTPHEWLRVDKVSKRFEDDISAVCLAVALQVDQGVIQSARIGAGGVAAVPARATQTEAACADQTWAEATFEHAAQVVMNEFEPLSDMRASADYRRTVLGNLLRRGWLQGAQPEAPVLAELQPEGWT